MIKKLFYPHPKMALTPLLPTIKISKITPPTVQPDPCPSLFMTFQTQ